MHNEQTTVLRIYNQWRGGLLPLPALHTMPYKHSRAEIALRGLIVTLRVLRRLLRVLLRPPRMDILVLLLVLYLIASFIGALNRPQGVLYPGPPTVLESR
jgi:hypothetical protein